MPFVTQIPSGILSVGGNGIVVAAPQTNIGNLFGSSNSFDTYDLGPGNDGALTAGDPVRLFNGETPVTPSGSYRGSAQITNTNLTVGVPGFASIQIVANPIQGQVIQGSDSNFYFVSDQEVGAARLSVTATVTILGVQYSFTGPISQVANNLADQVAALPFGTGAIPAAAIRGTQGAIQTAANAAIITFNNNPGATFTPPPGSVTCFVAGTLIETTSGMVPVETLKAGDLIATKDRGFQSVRWAGTVNVSAPMLQAMPNLRPVRIKAGALGRGTPAKDLLVSPQHRVLVSSAIANDMFAAKEVLIAAKHLVGVDGIELATDVTEVTYCHFLCDDHEIVYSNGAETETMFTGEMALRSVSEAARQEIFSLFPHLSEPDHCPQPARPFVNGRQSRALAKKHAADPRELT